MIASATRASRDDVTAFFTAHKLPAAARALDQTLERINNCIALREKQDAGLSRSGSPRDKTRLIRSANRARASRQCAQAGGLVPVRHGG